MQRLLERDDLDLSSTDQGGRSLLHVLLYVATRALLKKTQHRAVALVKLTNQVAEKNKEKVSIFNLDSKDSDGMSPILHAAVNGNSVLFEFLLEIGATLDDETIVNKEGRNICHHLIGVKPHECKDQLSVLREKVGEDIYFKVLSTPDRQGFIPIQAQQSFRL